MDTLQAAYRDDEDGYTSEAPTPPSQTNLDEEHADTPTTTAVATSATNPELLEYNQLSIIVEGHQTASLENVLSGEVSLPGTPQAMDTDQIAQRDTLSYTSPPLETDVNEEEGPPPTNQKHLFDLPEPKPSEPEITETPAPPAAIAPPPLNENPPVPFSEAPSPPLQTTAVLDGGSAGTPTASAVAILAMKSEQLEDNPSSGIKEGAMDTDQNAQWDTPNSTYLPLETAGNEEEGAKEEEGPQPSEPKITAIPLLFHSESPPSAKMDAVGDALPGDISLYGTPQAMETDHIPQGHTFNSPNPPLETDVNEEEGAREGPPPKKLKQLSDLPEGSEPKPSEPETMEMPPPAAKTAKKSKKKNKDVWSTTSRKGKKKTKHAFSNNNNSKGPNNGDTSIEDKVMIAPIPRFPDKNDDSPDLKICLSKVYKAEKVELSEDRLSASSTKGYRMVRATRGVTEGAWYFEIKVVHLGETGHTRLGWSTEKGDLQAPVGYDSNSYGYRDIDGNKVHKASREKYGDIGYKEGDVIGFYISLPDGGSYAPSPQRLVWHKGQRYVCAPDAKEESIVVPGSEILYFKNGICQGVAFTDLYGGCYYPAASMYTLPNEPACLVKFNFGPDFESFPEDFGERPVPRPMVEVPYQSYDGRVETGGAWNITRMAPMLKVIKEENTKIMKASEMVG